MLQKYFPIVGEVNSPLAMLAALNFTSEAAKVAISGISNKTLENLLWASVSTTEIHREASELEAVRAAASKAVKGLRYRAAQAARSARKGAAAARRIKAVRRPITSKVSAKALKGLDISICRARAAEAQKALKAATNTYNAALEAVDTAVNKGGDTRAIRSSVAALKAAVRTLEVRQLELRFAKEMLSIALARHSA